MAHKDVMKYIADFYEDLYTFKPTNATAQETLLNTIQRCLLEEVRAGLEGPLTLEECYQAMSGMEMRKSPGSDGLPVEFYLLFWETIGNDLVDVLNHSYEVSTLPTSMRLATIALAYKKGDKKNLGNWRPISLLNVDYKIDSKSLANQLQPGLESILHPDQTCNVPGRSITDNLLLIRDSFEYIYQKQYPIAMISFDQEKAFDRLDWSFLDKVMERMNFGESFCNWVKLVYRDVNCKILNNGNPTRQIRLSRGARQGCPLSPLLYCLVAETLANLIRDNPNIKGLYLPGHKEPLKISQYADDALLMLLGEYSMQEAFKMINIYEQGSGSKLNMNKTKGMWLGSKRGQTTGPIDITWITDQLKLLDIYVGSDQAIIMSWTKRIDKLESRLKMWKYRGAFPSLERYSYLTHLAYRA